MPTKKKAARKAKRVTAKRASGKAGPLGAVAIVHSTAYGENNKDCFDAGMADAIKGSGVAAPTTKAYPAQGDYSTHTLTQKVQAAVAANPALIVTAGGNIAAIVAANVLSNSTDKP
jgi:hypothetical protein